MPILGICRYTFRDNTELEDGEMQMMNIPIQFVFHRSLFKL